MKDCEKNRLLSIHQSFETEADINSSCVSVTILRAIPFQRINENVQDCRICHRGLATILSSSSARQRLTNQRQAKIVARIPHRLDSQDFRREALEGFHCLSNREENKPQFSSRGKEHIICTLRHEY